MQSSLIIFVTAIAVAQAAHSLHDDYPFHKVLDNGNQYEMYWKFNLQSETIHFAVKVQTEGWVGFGLSPNGLMPGSDIVIGWVDSTGTSHFNDRFAEERALPPIDQQQNWFLESAEQENGYTILEFYRNFTSCDDKDLDIKFETAYIVWSWHSNDPVNGVVQRHQKKGSTSLSLLGGLPVPRSEPVDFGILTVYAENITIPSHKDTTYWCSTIQIPDVNNNKEIYIYKILPNITEHTSPYVHHMVLYHCGADFNDTISEDCDLPNIRERLSSCYFGEVVAAWAVGGEGFVFPENVSLPFNTTQIYMLEMHYDNPMLHTGKVDSSGLNLYYSLTPTKIKAGNIAIGTTAVPHIIIPPNAETFTHESLCSSTCLDRYLPDNGVHIFASLLHTHLVGKALVVKHIRTNDQCGAVEELKPLDKDLRYDFNYQQFNHLPNEVHLKKGDTLLLQCIYRTKNKRTGVTLGGLGTRNEMCVAFFYYYPRTNLPACLQHLNHTLAYNAFVEKHLKHNRTAIQWAKISLDYYNPVGIAETFNQIDWTNATIREFESAVNKAEHYQWCLPQNRVFNPRTDIFPDSLPTVNCSYEAPDQCTNYQPQSCCERLRSVSPTSGAAEIGGIFLLIAALLTIVTLIM